MYYISFLKRFKNWRNLSVNQQIVYSFFVNTTIVQQKEMWNPDGSGRLLMSAVKEWIGTEEDFHRCEKMTNEYISEKTGISLRSLTVIMHYLLQESVIFPMRDEYGSYYSVLIPVGLIDEGFLKLPKKTGLKGMQLIFWAFLNERLRHYNEKTGRLNNVEIDTWASRLARDMGIKKKNVQNYIYCLTKRNFLKRSEDGKYLCINKDLIDIKTPKQLREEMKK